MFQDLINLFYPNICQICDTELYKNQTILCTHCANELPISNFHLDNENPVKKVFYGRLPLENAASLLIFKKKGSVQKLIHRLKYRGHQEIGTYLGAWLGAELAKTDSYRGIDLIIPVPLHKKKLRSRGFNQVEKFGKEIAAALNIEYVDDVLLKTSFSTTQTLKTRIARWGNIEESFVLMNSERIKNKHILLVDDLITTGATLEACADVLLEARNVKLSIATMAFTG
ncbi:ComF family protein [Gillisia sp. Hel_I_86]|uniref:ComF family protein n=1 Tax=Gillisia sp. Hel_I_86 TaxID=1249981 RepID=UPI00119ABEC3|nr:phosphoribosyltransferase family protein [Gillisia sp. Hel_I_86]TVZ26452.1 ComF family protein [Gillisia sp. Hel_I_86]